VNWGSLLLILTLPTGGAGGAGRRSRRNLTFHQSRSVRGISLGGRCCFPVQIVQSKKALRRRKMRMRELFLDVSLWMVF